MKRLVVAGVFALVGTACGSTAEVALDAPATEVTAGVAYTDAVKLDVYAPTGPGPWPVVVAVHGYSGSRDSLARLADAIASEGAVVFNLEATMIEPFLTAIEQVACSVRFARATAAEYGGDPTRITMVGWSGGAAASAVVALAGDDLEGDCAVAEGSALPDAMVGYEGPYDWAIHDYGRMFNLVPLREENPDLWTAINPYSHLGGNANVAVRLIHGIDVDDKIFEVVPEVSTEFHQALTEAGYDAELTVLDGAGHVDLAYPDLEASKVTVEQALEAARG